VKFEISSKEVHHFLLILETNILFAGLILRKSRLDLDEVAIERVGFVLAMPKELGF
jgi:hypothetical protein